MVKNDWKKTNAGDYTFVVYNNKSRKGKYIKFKVNKKVHTHKIETEQDVTPYIQYYALIGKKPPIKEFLNYYYRDPQSQKHLIIGKRPIQPVTFYPFFKGKVNSLDYGNLSQKSEKEIIIHTKSLIKPLVDTEKLIEFYSIQTHLGRYKYMLESRSEVYADVFMGKQEYQNEHIGYIESRGMTPAEVKTNLSKIEGRTFKTSELIEYLKGLRMTFIHTSLYTTGSYVFTIKYLLTEFKATP